MKKEVLIRGVDFEVWKNFKIQATKEDCKHSVMLQRMVDHYRFNASGVSYHELKKYIEKN